MKKLVKKILYGISFLLSLIFNNLIIYCFKIITYYVCTANFKRKLKHSGKNIYICNKNLFEGLNNVSIGNNFTSKDGLWMATYNNFGNKSYNPEIIIGSDVHLSRNCHIGAINKIVISDNVLIGSNVLINDHSHGNSNDFSACRAMLPLESKGGIFIGENTWICDNAIILGGVNIGKNCIIGANSVVTKSFGDGVMIAGNPAKIVKIIDRTEINE